MGKIAMHFGVTTSTFFFTLLLCWPSPAWGQKSDRIQVSISGDRVALTCPIENATWWKKQLRNQTQTLTIENYQGMQHNGRYICGSSQQNSSIYLQVKVCPGCVELDLWLLMGIVAVDALVTLGALILTHRCRQKWTEPFAGGPAAGSAQARPRGQREDRPPPVPNPDYEPIRKGQREVYAGLEPRAF